MAEAEVVRAIEELEHIGITIDESAAGESMPENTEQIPVKTPLAGVVLERLVTPGTTVTPGTPMFIVSELSSLWAIAEVDESHLGRLQVGRPVDVRVAAYPNARFPGTIAFIADMVNPKTRRITVRATVPNPDGQLKPEMYASVTVGESEPRRIQVVPRGAVQIVDGREVVFVETAAGQFTLRPVSVGIDGEDGVEIADGLAEGERVVVAGSFVLKSELLKARPEGGE
jgi:cobalt-zinc-cadmium efflux system membrane fusion protein